MGRKSKWAGWLWRLALALYGLLMMWLLFIRSRSGIWDDSSDYWTRVGEQFNLVPFHMIRDYWHVLTNPAYYMEKFGAAYHSHAWQAFINLFGNIGMLIPLGFLLPVNLPRLRRLWRTLLAVAVIIVSVELTQLFTLAGHCDIDDLILNLLGAAVGYLLFRLVKRKHRSIRTES